MRENNANTAVTAEHTAALAATEQTPAALRQECRQQEIALDGVRYVDVQHAGLVWHLGSTTPMWQQELPAVGAAPDAEALAALAARGMWPGPEQKSVPLAVMCCGLGSVWAGMGRELYDAFPAARAGMDRLAALADWDLLALMDEKDGEKISQTRWQIPYLFLVEYAQWCQLCSLGLTPQLMCGHSLGELIALCFAGIYSPEVAWYILDTRAVHMARLEAEASHETGMMAVHADASVIAEARAQWPELYISNYNTLQQCILSGPREVLAEARKSLRKRRIPAIMLNVSLAFHHPSMRLLRSLSLRRLNALEMRPARMPMLSDITTEFYPRDKEGICRYIADLDENTVRWVECVQAMWQRDGIRHFLELGPQETLCGLVSDIEPRALCFSAGRKGHEVEALRQACARLYALGHLHRKDISALARTRQQAGPAQVQTAAQTGAQTAAQTETQTGIQAGAEAVADKKQAVAAEPVVSTVEKADTACSARSAVPQEQMQVVLEVLAQASGRPVNELQPHMDLRYDLALRSSRFPLIVEQVEKRLGCNVDFEDLLQVSTIGDLARVLTGRGTAAAPAAEAANGASPSLSSHLPPPLCRWQWQNQPAEEGHAATAGSSLVPLPLDVAAEGIGLAAGDLALVCGTETQLLPALFSGLAPLGLHLALPAELLPLCASLEDAGAVVLPLPQQGEAATRAVSLAANADVAAAESALSALRATGRQVRMLFLLCGQASMPARQELESLLAALGQTAAASAERPGFCCVRRVAEAAQPHAGAWPTLVQELAQARNVRAVTIEYLDDGQAVGSNEAGDMLAREVLYGSVPHVVWARQEALGEACASKTACKGLAFMPRVELFPLVFADREPPLPPRATLFQGLCHFSRYADASLAAHGGQGENAIGAQAPWLPVSRSLQALLEAAEQYLPWLKVSGLADVLFYEPPLLLPALTRECRVRVQARPWLIHDGTMTRMCHADLLLRQVTENGRHTDAYRPLSEAMVLLAASSPAVAPLWDVEKDNGVGGQEILENFYAALGLQAPWKLLSSFTVLPDYRYSAVMAAWQDGIAPQGIYGYTAHLHLAEGVVQAALTALALHNAAPDRTVLSGTPDDDHHRSDSQIMAQRLRCWQLSVAGHVRFGALSAGDGPYFVQLRRTWADRKIVRFDAQVSDTAGQVVLSLYHLEFKRAVVPPEA